MFKVPIIPPDLRHEETMIQAAYALDCLQNTIGIIFGRIDERIEKNNVKLKELKERIKRSQSKIDSLHGTRKAIHIYAPSRFPGSIMFSELPVTFEKEHKLSLKQEKYQVETKLDPNLPSLNEKLIFFHVRDQKNVKFIPESSLGTERSNIKQNQDLGNMPSDLRSATSVLLYNTDYSVYDFNSCDSEAQVHSDAWKRTKILKNKRQQLGYYQQGSTKQVLEPAPHSLVHRRSEKLTPSAGLKYTPKLIEAPELDLPLDLPDLPGIADDLRYESPEAKHKITPSLAIAVKDLPELTELLKDSDKNAQISTAHSDNNCTIEPVLPSPPPMKQSAAPPPPPPPPAPELQAIQINSSETNKTKQTADTRSELMIAIRNAGGVARLRSATSTIPALDDKDAVDNIRPNNLSKKNPTNLVSSPGGDLMADLHNKLLMRRKGISGSKDNKDDKFSSKNTDNSPSGNPIISRLSSLIPPPPIAKRTSNSATTTSEEDESNDTDWID